jgi:hypothetical protein
VQKVAPGETIRGDIPSAIHMSNKDATGRTKAGEEPGVLRRSEEEGMGRHQQRGLRRIGTEDQSRRERVSLEHHSRGVVQIGSEEDDADREGEKLESCNGQGGPRRGIGKVPKKAVQVPRNGRKSSAIFSSVSRQKEAGTRKEGVTGTR